MTLSNPWWYQKQSWRLRVSFHVGCSHTLLEGILSKSTLQGCKNFSRNEHQNTELTNWGWTYWAAWCIIVNRVGCWVRYRVHMEVAFGYIVTCMVTTASFASIVVVTHATLIDKWPKRCHSLPVGGWRSMGGGGSVLSWARVFKG